MMLLGLVKYVMGDNAACSDGVIEDRLLVRIVCCSFFGQEDLANLYMTEGKVEQKKTSELGDE